MLRVEHLRTEFITPDGALTAVNDVSFALERGRAVGVVGESGSGKSAMARSIMRLLPKTNVSSSGRVVFGGVDMMALSQRELRALWGSRLSMVFQDPLGSLNPVMTVGRQVAEGLRAHLGMSRREARAAALTLLRDVGIPEPRRRIDEFPHQLSGGMRQRVVIAIALACQPELLIADEPTTALDVTVQAQILDLIERRREDHDMSLMLITHDLGVVAGRTDEIMVMYAGRVVERAPTRVLFSSMRHPYTEALLQSIPRIEYRSHTRLDVIPGSPPDMLRPPEGCAFAPRCKYASERCTSEEPDLVPGATPGHVHRCFLPVGSDEAADSLQRNIAAGRVSESGVVIAGPISR